MSQMSCPDCAVIAVLLRFSRPSCHVPAVLAALSSFSCPACPIPDDPLWLPFQAVLCRSSRPSCPFPAAVPTSLQLFCPRCPDFVVKFSLSCPSCFVLDALPQVYCPTVLYWLSCLQSCPGCPVRSLNGGLKIEESIINERKKLFSREM